jgi:hypothetical protein
MFLMRTCRDVTRLVLQREDRALSLRERLTVRLHMWICGTCPRFERQVRLMRVACRRWRAYAESDDKPA